MYKRQIQVTVTVPDGYTAYYTTDGSVPDAGATKYTAPVDLRLDAKVTFNVVPVSYTHLSPRRSGGGDLSSCTVGTCGGASSDPCDSASVSECHHGTCLLYTSILLTV